MANKIDQGIHLLLTHDEAQAILQSMISGEYDYLNTETGDFDYSPEQEKLFSLWANIRRKIKDELLDSAEHAT